jgi:flagellar biogenesis protein FliO
MNKNNERLMAILVALRKLPRWALITLTLVVIIVLGVAMFLLLPQTTDTQTSDPLQNSTSLAFSVFLKMSVVVILIVGLAIILRRWQSRSQSSQPKQINILETVHLSQHRTLYMIELNSQRILLGATDQSITNLCQINSSELNSNNSQASSENGFNKILTQVENEQDRSQKEIL